MSYIEYAEVNSRVSGLSDLVPDGKTADQWVQLLIGDAQAQVDAALASRYSVPFADPPALVKRLTFELTHYLILRENYRQEGAEVNEWVDDIRERAEAMLKQLASGDMILASATEQTGVAISSTSAYSPEFVLTRKDSDDYELVSGNMDVW